MNEEEINLHNAKQERERRMKEKRTTISKNRLPTMVLLVNIIAGILAAMF